MNHSSKIDILEFQHKQSNFFLNSINKNRINHCYIFYGPEGTGKTQVGILVAKLLNCQANRDINCNCKVCSQIEKNIFLDLEIITPQKEFILIEQVHNFQKTALLLPLYNKKIYIIKEADKLTNEAQNALLKILEEPPSNVIFILTTTNLELLLPTILSRAQKVKFNYVPKDQIKRYLIKRGVEVNRANFLAVISNGSIGRAIVLNEEFSYFEELNNFLNKLYGKTITPVAAAAALSKILKQEEKRNILFKLLDALLMIFAWNILYKADNIFRLDLSYEELIKKIDIIIKLKNYALHNVHFDLLVDNLILKLA